MMNRNHNFDRSCESIERRSIQLDEELLQFITQSLKDIKNQLPQMLQTFHKHLADKLTVPESERNRS